MVDTKLTGLTALTTLTDDDLLYVVDAPGTSPASKKATLSTLKSYIDATYGSTIIPGGRLSMESGTAVTTTDYYSGTSLWYNPYLHDNLPLWDGSKIVPVSFDPTVISLAGLSGTSSFDVFAYYNAGSAAFETSMWTSPTVRATNISIQNGRLCKVGDATRLYLGSFYTSAAGKSDDSVTKRFVWNYYNRKERLISKSDSSNHTASTSIRYWNNDSTQFVEYMCGVVENLQTWSIRGRCDGANTQPTYIGLGIDSSAAFSSLHPVFLIISSDYIQWSLSDTTSTLPLLGKHYVSILEESGASHSWYSYYLSASVLG